MKFDFSNKTAIVTGGTRGIGKGIVEYLQELGCNVIYTGTKHKNVEATNQGIYAQLDLADDESIAKFIQEVVETLPRVDILVNNAGITALAEVDQLKDEDWERVIKVNLTGPMRMTSAVAKIMKRGNYGGKILNIASIWGVISKTKRGAYSASKTGLI